MSLAILITSCSCKHTVFGLWTYHAQPVNWRASQPSRVPMSGFPTIREQCVIRMRR